MKVKMRVIFLALVAAATNALAGISSQYSITDLGIGSAYAINEVGQAAGLATTGSSFIAFYYSSGIKTLLGRFGKDESRAWGLNNLGTISGSYGGAGGQSNFAFTWAGGSSATIPLFNGYDINDSNQVVGDHISGANVSAAIYQNGSITELGTLGGNSSIPFAINAAGKVVGRARDSAKVDHAFFWQNGSMTSLYGAGSEAQDINNIDQIVGRIDVGGSLHHAVIWNGGAMTDINPQSLDSVALGINDLGTVVGYAGRAFIWSDGQAKFLNDLIPATSSWGPLRNAFDINNAGQIVGDGEIGGVKHAFLMTPVPEPGFILWAPVFLMLLRRRQNYLGEFNLEAQRRA